MTAKPPETSKAAVSGTIGLPAANEFSPGQVDLRELLMIVGVGDGDRESIIESIRQKFFKDAASSRADSVTQRGQQETRAYNALLGSIQYGLVKDSQLTLTKLGKTLLEASTDEDMYRQFARHIIRELHGFEVLVAVREMQASSLKVTKTTLQAYLEQFGGFRLPRATTHHTKLLQWLREAGVLPGKGYQISEDAVEQIAGMSLDDAETWAGLAADQKAFLRTLRRMALVEGTNDIPAKEVVDAVIAEQGPIFERVDQLAASIFKPLSTSPMEWIVHKTSKSGRGGKSGTVAATQKLLDTELDLLPEGDGLGIPVDLKEKLQTPPGKIYSDLDSSDTYVKGVALELLALRMAIDLTLTPVSLRERGTATGGAEVDLVAEATHPHFSRWLLQCKNTEKVGVSALAKEVGMASLLRAHVIVIVTTGLFSSAVGTYANELASTGYLHVVLVDKKVLTAYQDRGPSVLRKHFADAALQTQAIKRAQVITDTGAA